MVNREIIELVRSYVLSIPSNFGVKKVFLFGSYAKGTAQEESDIDIALVLVGMTDFFSIQRELMRLRRKIDLRIEPHPIDEQDFNSGNPFSEEIQSTGIEIVV